MDNEYTYGGRVQVEEINFYSGGSISFDHEGETRVIEITKPCTALIDERGLTIVQ